jgi:hypothetical protein
LRRLLSTTILPLSSSVVYFLYHFFSETLILNYKMPPADRKGLMLDRPTDENVDIAKYVILFAAIITMIIIFFFISYHDDVLTRLGYSPNSLNLFTPDTIMTYIALIMGWILVFYYMYKNSCHVPKSMGVGITVLLILSALIFNIGIMVLYKVANTPAMASFGVAATLLGILGAVVSIGYTMYCSKKYATGLLGAIPLVYYMLWLLVSYFRVDASIWNSGY